MAPAIAISGGFLGSRMPVIFSLGRKRPPTTAVAADTDIVLLGDTRRTVILVHGLT